MQDTTTVWLALKALWSPFSANKRFMVNCFSLFCAVCEILVNSDYAV